ncbi:MAG: indolepyruvate oxidoreductase subunit beta [Firmicutes bacterium]|nr:indolepyruvate oxidoreductase subunit beta [Bacillota bacterium]
MRETKNIILCGVGGQGTILTSKVLSNCLMKAGYDVKMSEVHGMAQRGGSVTTQVRFGDYVHSPIMGKGSADILVAFEKMEALRYLDMIKPEGKVILNDYEIASSTVLAGEEEYSSLILEEVTNAANASVLNACKIAGNIGNVKAMNIVLLGCLVKFMNLGELDWDTAIRENVKPSLVDLNIKAFYAGLGAVSN